MKIYKYAICFLFLISCNSKNTNNFLILKEAFVDWYNKNHLTNNYNYDVSYFSLINNLSSMNYYEDISRFKLELSQINKNELNSYSKIDYEIMLSTITRINLSNSSLKDKNNSLNNVVLNIYNSFYLIINDNKFSDFNKIILLEKHLPDVLKYLNNSKENLSSENNSKLISQFNESYYILINYLNYIIDLLEIDENSYNILFENINLLRSDLKKFFNWVNYDYSFTSSNLSFLESENNYYDLYKNNLFENELYNYSNTINFLKNKVNILKNNLFNESLSIYLNFNDEPVWVDKSDTLNVINWVVNNKIKVSTINVDDLVEKISGNYKNILDHYKNLNIQRFDTSAAKIILKKDYNIHSNYYCHGSFVLDLYDKNSLQLNDYFITNLIFEKIFSMHNIYGSLIGNNNSLRNIENELYSSGISLFLYELYINDLSEKFKLNKILFYINIIKKIEIAILQDKHNNNLDENKITEAFKTNDFFSNYLVDIDPSSLNNSNILYLESILSYLHLLNKYEEKVLIKKKLKKNEFINNIFESGYVNYYTIN
tara:strand:- start:13226 stop:14854 length:1629 start_codon:yes stop_codon:yes gene_type:complete